MLISAMDNTNNDDNKANDTNSSSTESGSTDHCEQGSREAQIDDYHYVRHNENVNVFEKEGGYSRSSVIRQKYHGWADTIMEIDMTEIKFQKAIGKGSFGVVHKAIWAGKTVAVKKVETDTEVTAFQNEIKQLSRVRHENIIQMYGIGTSLHAKCIIMEFANDGSLYQFLHCPPHSKYNLSNALSWLLQCAKAIAYLHAIEPRPIIHRDLKPLNLLLTNDRRVLKVCDFGTACDLRSVMTDNRGSTAWMAPEVIKGGNYNEKCDVYSWGMILWELLTRRIPFEELGQTLRILWQVVNKVRPPLIQGCPKPIERLMKRCWQDEQSERPSMQEVVDVVHPLYRIMSGGDGDHFVSCYSTENSTESCVSPLNGESTADHTSCDVSQITSSNNTLDYPPEGAKVPEQSQTPSPSGHLQLNLPYQHPNQSAPSPRSQCGCSATPEDWAPSPPGTVSPDASASVLVGVENLLPPWGSAKSDDVLTSLSSSSGLPPVRSSVGMKAPIEPIPPLSISIPNGGLHGPHPPGAFSSPWAIPVVTPPFPATSSPNFHIPPSSGAYPHSALGYPAPQVAPAPPQISTPPLTSVATTLTIAAPQVPRGEAVAMRPRPMGHDPAVVMRRRSAEVPHPPPQGHRRSSSYESSELIGFEPLADELFRETHCAGRDPRASVEPVPRKKDKFPPHDFRHRGGSRISEEVLSAFDSSADEPPGPQVAHSSTSPFCQAPFFPEVAVPVRGAPLPPTFAPNPGGGAPPRGSPAHFTHSPTKVGGPSFVTEGPGPSPCSEGTAPPASTEREELGAFWQLLDDDLKPTMPHPACPQSQQIFQEHKGLAHQLLVVQEEIVYLDKEKKRLLLKLEEQDREQQACRQRYTDKIVQLKNKNESLRHDHSRLSQQLEEIRSRRQKDYQTKASPDTQHHLHHHPSPQNSPSTPSSYFPTQHVQGGQPLLHQQQHSTQRQQHLPTSQYYYDSHHHHHLYPYTQNP